MMIIITWLLIKCFTITILSMDSVLHVEYFDVVLCGASVVTKNYPMDGLATISNSRKSQLQTNSANDAYLEWIPFDFIRDDGRYSAYFYGLPTTDYAATIKLIPLEITEETNDSYYDKVTIDDRFIDC